MAAAETYAKFHRLSNKVILKKSFFDVNKREHCFVFFVYDSVMNYALGRIKIRPECFSSSNFRLPRM